MILSLIHTLITIAIYSNLYINGYRGKAFLITLLVSLIFSYFTKKLK